jgi:transposase
MASSTAAVQEGEQAGAGGLQQPRTVFLPPYSPKFKPIEKMWSKVKTVRRIVQARSPFALRRAIALATVTLTDAAAWFRSCGYAPLTN